MHFKNLFKMHLRKSALNINGNINEGKGKRNCISRQLYDTTCKYIMHYVRPNV